MKNLSRILVLTIAVIALAFTSCAEKADTPLKSEVFQMDNLSELVTKIKADQKFSKEDLDFFTAALSRNIQTPDSINGKKIGDIIDSQKEFLRKSSITSFTNTVIASTVNSRYVGWEPDTVNKGNISGFKIYMKNRSKKDIKRVFGRLNFFNNQNQVLGLFDVNLTVQIGADKEAIILAKIAANNQNNGVNNMQKIRETLETAPNTLFAQWTVMEIEFADGKLISLNDKEEAKK
jgi:hypothetical protein